MKAHQHSIVDNLMAAYRAGRHLILLFDYDGTLVPIVDHPRLAKLDRPGRRLLERLAGKPRLHVGIISGRQLDELKEMLCLSALCFAGTGGLELDLEGTRLVHPGARHVHDSVRDLARQLSGRLEAFPGAWLEDKGLGLTVHYRHAPQQLIADLRTQLRETLEPFSPAFHWNDGPMALEITPDLGWDKGTAVSTIVHYLRPASYALLYAGDSANDAQALRTAAILGGIGIGIGPDAPRVAQYSLPDTDALHGLLSELERRLSLVTRGPVCAPSRGR